MNSIDKILDLFFPPVCGICGKIDKNSLCEECNKKINEIKICQIEKLSDKNIFYKKFAYMFKYDGIIRDKILDYKFNDRSYLYKTFEKIILDDIKICDFIKTYDMIVPVPIHNKRKLERGYNQSELIIKNVIKELSKDSNIFFDNTSLIKIKNILKQSSLNKEERAKNIEGAYTLTEHAFEKFKNKKVLLFDDILTTGSTVNECSKIIEMAKPHKIGVFTLAK